MIKKLKTLIGYLVGYLFSGGVTLVFIWVIGLLAIQMAEVTRNNILNNAVIYSLLDLHYEVIISNMVVWAVVLFIGYGIIGLLGQLLIKMKFLTEHALNKFGALFFKIFPVAWVTLFLITSLNKEQFSIAIAIISFVALFVSSLRKKIN